MPNPCVNLSKKVPAVENFPESGNLAFVAEIPAIIEEENVASLRRVMPEESDPEVLAAAAVLFGLQFGGRAKASGCEWWSAVPKKKKSPRMIRKVTGEFLDRRARKLRKRKFRDSSNVILEEGREMKGGEAPAWVEATVRELGGSHARLVVQKKLFDSDVTSGQSRFSIPRGRIAHRFLTREESESLDNGNKIMISLIQPCGKISELLLGKWRLNSSSSYVLTKNWTSVWKEPRNGLRKGEVVQLWSYRVEGKLCFWLVKVPTITRFKISSSERGVIFSVATEAQSITD